MCSLRLLLKRNGWLALAFIVLALATKALVPQGYMVSPGKSFTVTLCTGMGLATTQVVLPAAPGHDKDGSGGKAQDVCPFSSLSHAAMAVADPLLLGAALAFILLLGIAPTRAPVIRRRPHLSPPLRGPPTFA